jgi:hypothetical protein
VSHRASRSSGVALPAALIVVAVAAAVSAALATLAREELVVARGRETAARALAAADGCAAAVVADLPAGWEFDTLIAGADGVSGTPDDGERAAPPGCTARLRAAPGPLRPPRAVLDVEATAGSGRRAIEAIVARTGAPGIPALIWLADAASLRTPAGTLALDATDAALPGAQALPPLAAPADPASLDAWLATQGARVTVSPAGVGSLRGPPPPVAELAARMRAAGAASAGTLVPAGAPPLALTLVAGDLTVPSIALGHGLLLVDGLLDIAGTFEFNGVVVASAGIRVAAGARLDVAGSIWLGSGASLLVDGDARVAARLDALEAADGLLPLPRRASLADQRDPP